MSAWSQCGNCAKCGAPLWLPMVWWSITPPPVTRSCNCFGDSLPGLTITTASYTVSQPAKPGG